MASKPKTEAAPVACNVVRLPTAAKRRAQNYRYAAQREARAALRAETPWPGEYRAPWQRKRDREQEQLSRMHRTPETAALLILLTAFPEDRLPALDAAADLMAARHPEDADSAAGVFLVKRAIEIREAMALAAKTGGR